MSSPTVKRERSPTRKGLGLSASLSARSPTRKVKSPTRKVKSPTRKVKSPTRKAQSPTRKAQSPARKAQSPTRKAQSPARKAKSPRSPRVQGAKREKVDLFAKAVIDRAITNVLHNHGNGVERAGEDARRLIQQIFEEYAVKKASAINLMATNSNKMVTIMGRTVDAYYTGLDEVKHNHSDDEINLQTPAIRRVLARGGAKRVSAEATVQLRRYWTNYLVHIILASAEQAKAAKRATLRVEDIEAAREILCIV